MLVAAGLITTGTVGIEVGPETANWRLIVPAVLSERFENVATPPTKVTATVPFSVPAPLPRYAVTTVVLSPVRRLPKASFS